MPDEKDLSRYRMDKARQCLVTAKSNLVDGDYCASVNRSYYSVFHAMRAVLALDDFDSKKHSGIIAEFRRKYIKGGTFPVELSDILAQLFQVRNSSDYADFYVISKSDAEQQTQSAGVFLDAVDDYRVFRRRNGTANIQTVKGSAWRFFRVFCEKILLIPLPSR